MNTINSKLTLIIDGNWLLMSRMPVLQNRYADELTLMKEAKLLMVKSINIVLRTFPQIDNIIFVADGGSWRTSLPVPEFIKNKDGSEKEYKGNREKSVEINWDIVFKEYGNMMDVMSKCGISVFREEGIEGDDWCWYWSRRMNSLGTNVIIWSKDRDLTQLVQTTKDGYFTIVWNKDNGVFMEADEDLTNMLLNPYYQMNEKLLQEIVQASTDVIKVDPEEVRISKIICGDAGDNIMPAITRKPKNGSNKIMKVMKKDLPSRLDYDSEEAVLDYICELNGKKLYAGNIIETEEQICEHVKYNRKLVVLDKASYPEEVLASMEKYSDWYDTHKVSIAMPEVESQLLADKNSIMSILDDI